MNDYERQTSGAGDADPKNGRTPEEIEREIEATRERMSRDIDELGTRLSPDNLKRQAKEAITGKAHEVVSNVGAGARRTGFRMMDFIQENTSLVAAMGLGAVWLIQQRNRSEVSGDRMTRFAYTGPERRGNGISSRIADRAGEVRHAIGSKVGSATESVSERAGEIKDRARERVGDLAERAEEIGSGARERARELGHRAQEQTRRARSGLERVMEENPLAVAAGVGVIGLAAGLLVPETERERRTMGPVRDDLADRAQTAASKIKDAAVEAGQDLKESVQEEIKFRTPEIKSTLSDVAQTVTEQVKESAGRVKEEAKQAAKQSSAGRKSTE
jgi:gas vesicle protein